MFVDGCRLVRVKDAVGKYWLKLLAPDVQK